jgi:hypothetical protein
VSEDEKRTRESYFLTDEDISERGYTLVWTKGSWSLWDKQKSQFQQPDTTYSNFYLYNKRKELKFEEGYKEKGWYRFHLDWNSKGYVKNNKAWKALLDNHYDLANRVWQVLDKYIAWKVLHGYKLAKGWKILNE